VAGIVRRVALWRQLAIAGGTLAAVTVLAEVAGADSLGVALGIGQIAFAFAVIGLLLWA
jgi:hypothetical protein